MNDYNPDYLEGIADIYGENSPEYQRLERLMAERVWHSRKEPSTEDKTIPLPLVWQKNGITYKIRNQKHASEIVNSPNFNPFRHLLSRTTHPPEFADSLDATALTHQWHYLKGIAKKVLDSE